MNTEKSSRIAVIIPCFKVKKHILKVIESIGPEVSAIYIVDDCCPEESGRYVEKNCTDMRVKILCLKKNSGVGAATVAGFQQAACDGYDILIKVDGDDQMDTSMISAVIRPIVEGEADYTKGNRFITPRSLKKMPFIRLVGNGILSFFAKVSSGYWNLMDPTNGFIAIHAKVFQMLESDVIERRYFFESDMLYRLHLINAVVVDVPMKAIYGEEESNLKIGSVIFPFLRKHISRILKRIIYEYFVREFNVGSAQILSGLSCLIFSLCYGGFFWLTGIYQGHANQPGVVVITAVSLILGFQLLLSALNFDISKKQNLPLHLLPMNIGFKTLSQHTDYKILTPSVRKDTDIVSHVH
ncbi:MAG: glycosyltransferase family 2 protein [Deltaproteobacteria bacterium]|nr:glycosyltransferase family 2 protein [Deltaproteobacteria bacterium]